MNDMLRHLHAAGASDAFLRVYNYGVPTPIERNSIVELVGKLDEITEEQILKEAGHFGQALFEGDLEEAWYRADGTNTFILTDLYNERVIDAHMKRNKLPRAFKNEHNFHESWQ